MGLLSSGFALGSYENFKTSWRKLKSTSTLFVSEIEWVDPSKIKLLGKYGFVARNDNVYFGSFHIGLNLDASFKLRFTDSLDKKCIKIKCLADVSCSKVIQHVINSIIFTLV